MDNLGIVMQRFTVQQQLIVCQDPKRTKKVVNELKFNLSHKASVELKVTIVLCHTFFNGIFPLFLEL